MSDDTPRRWGAAYERHVGSLYEAHGFRVIYRGIERGSGDRGIDLLATKGHATHLVQCKLWTALDQIPIVEIWRFADACRAHIARHQPSGQPLIPALALERRYVCVFVTSSTFSERAQREATRLEIALRSHFTLPAARAPIRYAEPDHSTFESSSPQVSFAERAPVDHEDPLEIEALQPRSDDKILARLVRRASWWRRLFRLR